MASSSGAAGPPLWLAPPVLMCCPLCGAGRWSAEGPCWTCGQFATPVVPPPIRRRERKFAGRDLVSPLVLFAVLAATVLAGGVAAAIGRAPVQAILVVSVIDTAIVALWALGAYQDVIPLLGRFGGRWLALAPVLGVGTFLAAHLFIWLVTKLLDVPDFSLTGLFANSGYGWGMVILFCCVQPAVVEEVAFRGIILGGLARVMGSTGALLTSSAMFMVMHFNPVAGPHLFLMGLALAFLRLRSGSLYPAIVLHGMHNLLCLLGEMWNL